MHRRFVDFAVAVLPCCLVLCASAADQPNGKPSRTDASQGPESVVPKQEPSSESAAEPLDTDLPIRYAVDFRDGNFDREHIVPVGSLTLYSWTLLKREPRGLRITIPWHQGKEKPTLGISPAFTIHGDFQITASYELVAADSSETAVPVGGQIYIMAQKTHNGASILRGVVPGGRQVYVPYWAVRDENGRKPVFESVPAEARRGKLRFARTGEMLHLLVAEEDSNEFRELGKVEFGRDPIGMFRAESITNGAASTAETLWSDIEIRAEKLQPVEIPLLGTNGGTLPDGAAGAAENRDSDYAAPMKLQ